MTEPDLPRVPGRGSGDLEELLAEDFPRMLMLQTTSACNANCVFCPLPGLRRKLPQGQMDDELFRCIVEEAGHHPRVACINLFLMNEPLCDGRMVKRIHLAHRHNPQAQISLWTNAVALRPRLTERLLRSPLGSLGVSLHAHDPRTYRRLTGRKDFSGVLRHLVYFVEQRLARRPDLHVVLRYVGADLYLGPGAQQELEEFWAEAQVTLDITPGYLSRAGNLEAPASLEEPLTRLAGCRAFGGPKQAHVLYTGQVVLCCMDYQRLTSLGDMTQHSLQKIWAGKPRRELLRTLYGRQAAPPEFLCSRCEMAIPADSAGARRCDPDIPPDMVWANQKRHCPQE